MLLLKDSQGHGKTPLQVNFPEEAGRHPERQIRPNAIFRRFITIQFGLKSTLHSVFGVSKGNDVQ